MGYCIVLDVDGDPVRFQLAVPPDQLTDQDREAMIELVRWLRTRHEKSGDTPLEEPTPLATPTPGCQCWAGQATPPGSDHAAGCPLRR